MQNSTKHPFKLHIITIAKSELHPSSCHSKESRILFTSSPAQSHIKAKGCGACPSLSSWSLQAAGRPILFLLSKAPPTQSHPCNSVCAMLKPSAHPAFSLSPFPPPSSSYSTQPRVKLPLENPISLQGKASLERRLAAASVLVHTLTASSPISAFSFSTSDPLASLETPCKVSAPPQEQALFDKGQEAAQQITPKSLPLLYSSCSLLDYFVNIASW